MLKRWTILVWMLAVATMIAEPALARGMKGHSGGKGGGDGRPSMQGPRGGGGDGPKARPSPRPQGRPGGGLSMGRGPGGGGMKLQARPSPRPGDGKFSRPGGNSARPSGRPGGDLSAGGMKPKPRPTLGGFDRPGSGGFPNNRPRPDGGLSSRPNPRPPGGPSLGGSRPDFGRPSKGPDLGNRPPRPGNRPGFGGAEGPGGIARPTPGKRPGDRPGTRPGGRPSPGDLGGFLGIDRPNRPGTLPGNIGGDPPGRPGGGDRPGRPEFPGLGGGDRPGRPGGGARPGRPDFPGLGGGDRPGRPGGGDRPNLPGDGNRPGRPGDGDRPGRPGGGDRPNLPGDGNRPGRPGDGDRPGRPGGGDRPNLPGDGNRPGRPGDGDRPGRPGGGDRPNRPGGGNRPERPGNGNRPNRPGDGDGWWNNRPGRPDRPNRPGDWEWGNNNIHNRPSWIDNSFNNNNFVNINNRWNNAITNVGVGPAYWNNRPNRWGYWNGWANGVRDSWYLNRNHCDWFGPNWWYSHAHPIGGWHYSNAFYSTPWSYWWTVPAWGSLTNFFSWSTPTTVVQPVPYDYGTGGNVYYEDNSVVINGQPVCTAEEFAQSAALLATVDPPADPQQASDSEWMPLGTFALSTGTEDTNPARVVQLAVNRDGIVSGTLFNSTSDSAQTLLGRVDKLTQRVAVRIGNRDDVVLETGLFNLTEETAPALVHFGTDQTEKYLLVRLEQPLDDDPSLGQ